MENQEDTPSTTKENLEHIESGGRQQVRSMEHMFYDTIDGVNYYCVNANGRFRKQLPIIRELNLRSDDVIVCGYPKSGNHWIFEVVSMILRQTTDFSKHLYYTSMLEFLNPEVQTVLGSIPSPRVLATHLRPSRFPQQVWQKRIKLVVVLRNPKDVAVSQFCQFADNGPSFMRYNGSFSQFLDIFLKGHFLYGSWFDYIWAYEKFMKESPEHPVFVLSYEKMKLEPADTIRQLCSFLTIPAGSLADGIARATEFSHMKSTLLGGKMKIVKEMVCSEGKDFIFRKGQIGTWRLHLNEERNQLFNNLFGEKMAGCRLADLVQGYI